MTLSLRYGMWAIKSKYILLFRNTLCNLLKFDYCFIYVMNIKKKLPHSQTVRYTTIKTLELKVHSSVMDALLESCTMMHLEVSPQSYLSSPDSVQGGQGGSVL